MPGVDIRKAGSDFIIHFGVEGSVVHAATLSDTLSAIRRFVEAANDEIEPGSQIEIYVEALTPGSFKAQLKLVRKNLLSLNPYAVAGTIFINVFSSYVYDELKPPHHLTTVIDGDTVTVTDGDSTVIINRSAHEVTERAARQPKVREAIQAVFEAVERDPEVTAFGLASDNSLSHPDIFVPRASFPKIIRLTEPQLKLQRRSVLERSTQVVVLKAWLERGDHKWSFNWRDGIKISATIKDDELWDQVESRAIILGSGDILVVDLEIQQEWVGVTWLNQSYAVVKYHSHKQASSQQPFPKT